MLSGTIPDSVLGKQRQTHDRESQGGWIQRNQLPTILHPAKQHIRDFWWVAWGKKDDTTSGENLPFDPQILGHTKLHLMTWK